MKLGIFISPKGFSEPCYLFSNQYGNLLLLTDPDEIVVNIKNYYLLKFSKFNNESNNYFTSSINISIFYIYIFFLTLLLFILICIYMIN